MASGQWQIKTCPTWDIRPRNYERDTKENINEGKVENKDEPTPLTKPFAIDERKYSSPLWLLRSYGLAVKLCWENWKTERPNERAKGYIDVKETKILWNKFIQNTNFPEGFNDTSGIVNKKDHKNQLGILLHEDGLLNCHRRMIHVELPLEAIYPILLPKRSLFTSLLVKECHL